ncbi:hypothetical protein KM043_001497 [Ampulex compressa]|nr:hypothetical protein KM043_001497 [Ampulex compressa]
MKKGERGKARRFRERPVDRPSSRSPFGPRRGRRGKKEGRILSIAEKGVARRKRNGRDGRALSFKTSSAFERDLWGASRSSIRVEPLAVRGVHLWNATSSSPLVFRRYAHASPLEWRVARGARATAHRRDGNWRNAGARLSKRRAYREPVEARARVYLPNPQGRRSTSPRVTAARERSSGPGTRPGEEVSALERARLSHGSVYASLSSADNRNIPWGVKSRLAIHFARAAQRDQTGGSPRCSTILLPPPSVHRYFSIPPVEKTPRLDDLLNDDAPKGPARYSPRRRARNLSTRTSCSANTRPTVRVTPVFLRGRGKARANPIWMLEKRVPTGRDTVRR